MEFEWNEDKRLLNLKKHGVDLLAAALIFEGACLTRVDDRQDYGEQRLISVGMADGECFVVVYTNRDGVVRLISAWKGGRRERREYQARIVNGVARNEGPK